MSTVEVIALVILMAGAVVLVFLGLNLDGPIEPVDQDQLRYRPRHSSEGETTRLRPPRD